MNRWIKLTVRCPDFWFKADNQIDTLEKQHFVEDFGSDDDDGYTNFYFEKDKNQDETFINIDEFNYKTLFCRKKCLELLSAFLHFHFRKFIGINFEEPDLLGKDFELKIRDMLYKQLKENAFIECYSVEKEKTVGYFKFDGGYFIDA